MPIRFSTQAANADKLDDDAKSRGAPEGMPQGVGADGTPQDKEGRKPAGQNESGDAKPGKDINAPGFVKDKDAGKP